jgi:all-trans-retinol dehydrogenase (NAD+)
MSYFAGKRILITGAGSGLGRRMALAMAREGGRIIGWDISSERLSAVLAELKLATGSDHHGFVCDVADSAQVYATAEQVRKTVGPPQILINNAGVVSGKHFLACSDREIETTMGVNAMALFWTAKAFLPDMIAADSGHVVTVASAAGLVGVARLADYSASKFAAVGFDESLRAELRQTAPGVKTTVICPFYIDTGMFAGVKTRFAWLLPIMGEVEAVTRMVAAIRERRARLIMPPLVFTVPLLRLLPVVVFDWVADFLGINRSMDAFFGRAGRKGKGDTGNER